MTKHDVCRVENILDDIEDMMEKEQMLLLRKLVNGWIKNDSETQLQTIEKMLEKSDLPMTKLVEFVMLLKDIRRNYNRVNDILLRMQDILQDENIHKRDILRALKSLFSEELITYDQYNQLAAMIEGGLNMKKLIGVMKTSKIGRGEEFLPRETTELKSKLEEWSHAYEEEQSPDLKKKIVAALEELKCRKAISKPGYKILLEALQ